MADDIFDLDFDPPVGVSETVAPDVRRIVAPNASPMTFTGTNTYLLGTRQLAVIDPGPDDPRHLTTILDALGAGQEISHIIVTHSHVDHSPLSRALARASGAQVYALGDSKAGTSRRMQELATRADLGGGEGVDHEFRPDICLADGAVITGDGWRLDAIATPGHFPNHMCFAHHGSGTVFSGDHVMGWATTMISPPGGDLTAFMRSLETMLARRGDRRYLPGHGNVLKDPATMLEYLLRHRRARSGQIIEALQAGPASPRALAEAIYLEIPQALLPAATRNVLAHLIDLLDKNTVSHSGVLSADTVFHLTRAKHNN